MSDSNPRSPRLVELSGSRTAMGAQHGEILREQIQELAISRTALCREYASNATADDVIRVSQHLWNAVETALPAVAEEVTATARAANLTAAELLVAGALTDVCDVVASLRRTARPTVLDECTVVISAKPVFIAGTWDTHQAAVESLVLLRREPAGAPATLALTTAGWPAQQGLNSAKVGFAITNLTPRKAVRTGLPYIAVNAFLADTGSAEAFLGAATRFRYASGHAYLVADARTAGVLLTTSDANAVRTVTDQWVQANHFDPKIGLDDNSCYPHLLGSQRRVRAMATLLTGSPTAENFVRALTRDPTLYREDRTAGIVTGAYFYIEPDAGRLYCGSGKPEAASWFAIN